MFSKLFKKLDTFEEHHQVLFALVVVLGIILISWGVEKILEEHIFPHRPFYGYVVVIVAGLAVLWLAKHVVLHVM
jgi:hypothetical protein